MSILSVKDLKVFYGSLEAVKGVSLEIAAGETLAIVGESGCGKSSLALAIPRLLAEPPATVRAESVRICGQEVAGAERAALRPLRGCVVGTVFQDPMTALSPLHRIGRQIAEAVTLHRQATRQELDAITHDWLKRVGISDPARVARSYPHELSGGMQQRVMIAMAMVNNPSLLIADEPTTALDAITQAQVLELMRGLVGKERALLLVTHDMGVVRRMATRVAVMHDGEIVETAPREELFGNPQHPYTRELLAAMPPKRPPLRPPSGGTLPTSVRQAPLVHKSAPRSVGAVLQTAPARSAGREAPPALVAQDLRVWFPVRGGLFSRTVSHVKAVDGVSFTLQEGEVLSIVGESGSGKTTLTRAILGLAPLHSGSFRLFGQDPSAAGAAERRAMRRSLQVVFQDPFASLNPRHTVLELVTGAMVAQGLISRREAPAEARRLLAEAGLPGDILDRLPHEFSGGQRQRIAIARAMALSPRTVICDEAVSALDLSIRAHILRLLLDLRDRHGLSYLFITHDLAVARMISNRIAVMHGGRFVEEGPAEDVLDNPQSDYTRALLAAN